MTIIPICSGMPRQAGEVYFSWRFLELSGKVRNGGLDKVFCAILSHAVEATFLGRAAGVKQAAGWDASDFGTRSRWEGRGPSLRSG